MIRGLISGPQGYNLFQAIMLLERSVAQARPLGTGNGTGEALRLSGHVSLAFQSSDVRAVSTLPDVAEPTRYMLSTPVMTLAGAGGPLPLAYCELMLARRAARDHTIVDFLDIFNHRYLSFLYRGRKKQAPGLNPVAPYTAGPAACLSALANLGYERDLRGPRAERLWLRHAGLLASMVRSMAGLLALLGDRLGVAVQGEQFVGAWRALDPSDYSSLSRAARDSVRLDGTRALGRRAWDRSAGIAIAFLDLDRSRFESLLPGGREHELALWLIRNYLRREMIVIFALRAPSGAPERRLSATAGPRLGWTSCLGGGSGAAARAPLRLVAARPAPNPPSHGG